MKYDELKAQKRRAHEALKSETNRLSDMSKECERVANIAKNANIIIGDLDKKFEMATKLTGVDKTFLFTAIALQCIRQYVIGTITQRKDHNESDKSAHKIQEKLFHSDNDAKKIKVYREEGTWYKATTEEIMASFSVPYDVTKGTKKFGVGGIDEKGNGIGLGGKNHRYKTLGHDPLFGWVFGTSNIMTNTLTNNMGQTYHVRNSEVMSNGGYEKTVKMFEHVKNRSKEKPADLGICIIKQGLHIMSDTYSKEGIVLPGTVSLNSELAGKLSDYGVDLGNVLKVGMQAGFAVLINQIIAMIHGLLYDESRDMSWNLYSVRTRKILLYSNGIASMSNVIAVACGAMVGVLIGNAKLTETAKLTKRALNYLDIGGLIVTIHRIVSDKQFIYEIKKEFMEREWYNLIMMETVGENENE